MPDHVSGGAGAGAGTAAGGVVSFVVAEGLESSLHALVSGMLPLCAAGP